jgi:hypothetical protein
MNKVAIGIGVGITLFTAVILVMVSLNVSATGSRSNDGDPIQLIAVCEGEGTNLVSCTWIPLEESKRTEAEQALAERAVKE